MSCFYTSGGQVSTAARGLLVVFLGCGPLLASEPAERSLFDAQRYAAHVEFLASDECEGRGPGSQGIERAADYVARQFASCGLRPAGDDGTYFQKFEVTLDKKAGGNSLLKMEPETPAFTFQEDYIPLPFSSPGAFDGPVAFVGYGIEAEEFDYDDYAGFDAKGKVLLMLRYEPPSKSDTDFDGPDLHSDHALFSTKARRARNHHAAAVLIVNPPVGHEEEDRLYSLGRDRSDYRIPMMHIKREVAERLLKAAGLPGLAELQTKLDEDRQPQSRDLPGVRVFGDTGLVKDVVSTRNVIGLLPGTGDLADEFLVIGAHYDHLGRTTRQFPSNQRQDDPNAEYIHHGADDNASGTAGLIELARALGNGSPGPRRSVLFIAFSGEELGLLGSEHFVNHPTIALDKVVAMFNLDMIGRMKESKLTVSGVASSSGFRDMVKKLAEAGEFDLATQASGAGPSDHTSFYAKKIPVLHFFSGLHLDYHKPTDTASKINYEGAVRILGMVASASEQICRADQPPDYKRTKLADRGKKRSGLRVRMGIMPSYADDDKLGMTVTGVIEGGPADQAGMQDGDRILSIGPALVNNIYDYMDALADYKPGQEVVVNVNREGQRISLQIKLGGSSG